MATTKQATAKELAERFLAEGMNEELLTDDFRWIVPQSLSDAIGGDFTREGLAHHVHALHEKIYDVATMQSDRHFLIGEGDWAAFQFEVHAKNKAGGDYHNFYCLTFHARDGKLDQIREHVDTLYTKQVLFEPAGLV